MCWPAKLPYTFGVPIYCVKKIVILSTWSRHQIALCCFSIKLIYCGLFSKCFQNTSTVLSTTGVWTAFYSAASLHLGEGVTGTDFPLLSSPSVHFYHTFQKWKKMQLNGLKECSTSEFDILLNQVKYWVPEKLPLPLNLMGLKLSHPPSLCPNNSAANTFPTFFFLVL